MDPTPEDVKRLAAAREEFILKREQLLGRTITSLERHLMDQILGKFAGMLTNSNGVVTFRGKQITLTAALDEIFADFNANQNLDAVRGMVRDLGQLGALNANYYGMYTTSKKRTDEISKKVNAFMQQRIGIDGNSLTSGGFLDTFVNDTGVRDYLKKYTYNAVTGGASYRDFLRGLRVIVEGTDETNSKLRQHYKTFAFDTFSEFDAATGNQWRQQLGLKAGLYAGNLIDTSRKFCIERNGKVFTLEEMETWKDDPDLPLTKEERAAGGGPINYIPWINKGRWECRHQVNWLSKQIAIALRPDLKEYYAQK